MFLNTFMFQNRFNKLVKERFDYKQAQLAKRRPDLKYSGGRAPQYVIFDCSRLTYVDRKGVDMLLDIHKELSTASPSTTLMLANLNGACYAMLMKCGFFDTFNGNRCFVTVHDAFTAATIECEHDP